MLRRGVRIRSYGASNLTRMDSTFEYTAFEGDVPVRTFTVGPQNPMFRSLERIPAHLQYSVLTAEDGGYYQHRGFLTEQRKSKNIDRQSRTTRLALIIAVGVILVIWMMSN